MADYPIDHLSYSAMMLFLRNRFAFKKRYILKLSEYKTRPSALIGKAGHKALQKLFNGDKVDVAIKEGLDYVTNFNDDWIEWGETGSREACIKKYIFAINSYLEEMTPVHKVLGVEQTSVNFIEYQDKELAIPIKSITDLVHENKAGELEIIDHKFVIKYTKSTVEKGTLAMQSMFNYYNVKKEYGRTPTRMIYNECKVSKNKKTEEKQLQPYIIEFDKHPDYHEIFFNLFNEIVREISRPDCQYLPNFQDMFGAEETFADYKAQVISVENPILIEHKTKEQSIMDKEYVPSAVHETEKKFYTAEEKIKSKLLEFGIAVEMSDTHKHSSIIQYTLKPPRGRRMTDFEKYRKDLALALEAETIRIQAPIMGTNLVGIEVPNPDRQVFNYSKDCFDYELGSLNIPIGIDVYGSTVTQSLAEMPHLLIAGATGSGKSVMINVLISALLDQNTPDQLKLVLIDPKRVELSAFKNSANLLSPVISDVQEARRALYWLVDEMEARYTQLEQAGARNIDDYNLNNANTLHKVVIVIDEFADLMMRTREEKGAGTRSAETAIVLLAQKARAIGIHLVLGTQRPSVDVVTGLIKANLPARICFMTASKIDSQVTLDQEGADQLIGKGDMLYLDPGNSKITRLQGFYK